MFILDGKILSPDIPFTYDGVTYPPTWLRTSTLEEKLEIGIIEQPEPPFYDQRFYWGYDSEGNLIPKDHAGLVTLWVAQARTTANTLLTPSDWLFIRQIDNGTVVDPIIKQERQAIRTSCETKVAAIEATTTTDELAAYITSSAYSTWTVVEAPLVAEEPVTEEVAEEPVVEEDINN